MAVFTPVSTNDVQQLLASYDIGEVVNLAGIAAGIENSNFFLTTTRGEFVLTIFEVLTFQQLPFYVELMHHLANKGVLVPMPQTRRDGERISTLHGKPCIIVTRLDGGWVRNPSEKHCEIAARTQAHIHLAGKDFKHYQPNLRGLPWWQQTVPKVIHHLGSAEQDLLQQSLDEQVELAKSGKVNELPNGPAHCDYFRDNVLFSGSEDTPTMGGVIDFYFAGCDHWLFDVAVAVNDWCVNIETGELVLPRLHAWLKGYTSLRPFTALEREVWPLMLRAAALRFWISRLFDYYNPRPAETLKPHDPTQFEKILKQRTYGQIEPLKETY